MAYSRNNNNGGGITAGDKGDITVASNGTWTIDNNAVTDAKINDVSASKVTQSPSYRFTTDTEKSTWNAKQDSIGFTPVTNARSISTTAPLSGGGDLTANRTLSISQATTSTNGYLSSTDWNIFNGKQASLGYTPLNPSNNLSDLNNVTTARTNLKIVDLYLTAGNQTTTSAAASNITALVYSASASKRYKISGIIHIGCSGVGGVKIQIAAPTGSTVYLGLLGYASTTTAQLSTLVALSTLSIAYNTANGTAGFIKIDGEVQLSTTAGNIQFGFASTTASQTSTIYQLGTCITITEL